MKFLVKVLLITFLAFSGAVFAQSPQPELIAKGKKTLVSVPVTVSDLDGRYIADLDKDDFKIYHDGIKQKISLFETHEEKLNVALLIDTSGSTQEAILKIKDAAKDFVDLLKENDQCFVATFDSQLQILQDFSSNKKELKKTIDKTWTASIDGTILYQAIAEIAQNSFNDVQGRKVIVLLSDGKDFGSKINTNDVINLLEESDILIYSIFYQTGDGFNKLVLTPDGKAKEGKVKKKKEKKPKNKGYTIFIPNRIDVITDEDLKGAERLADLAGIDFFKEMADTTAGRFYLSDTPNLGKVFKRIAGELREQYRLGYYLEKTPDKVSVHNIMVKVEKSGVAVRTREKFRN